jgi:lysophospholipase L1-like esterase
VTRRYLALGDSYTIGEGVDASDGWPVQLAAAMREAGVSMADPVIVARTGWTTTELLAAIDSITPPLERDYDFVSLLIGVNDQYRGRTGSVFREGFSALLSCAVNFAGGDAQRFVVVSIPDWSVTPFARSDPRGAMAIAAEIDALNAVAGEDTRQAGAQFVDITTLSRRAASDRTLLATDGLHPSRNMYALWVQTILPAALRSLNSGGEGADHESRE